MSTHALCSPSSAAKWMGCPASLATEKHFGVPDTSSEYADEGTAAHYLGAWCLDQGTGASQFEGQTIVVAEDGARWADHPGLAPRSRFVVDDEMVGAVQQYLDDVRRLRGQGEMFVEVAVPIGHITGEEDASGTADVVILQNTELQIHDLKYGMTPVSAERNRQLMLYALGVLDKHADTLFETVRLVIHQPRVYDGPREWVCPIEDLDAFRTAVMHASIIALDLYDDGEPEDLWRYQKPSDEACQWCRAKARCKTLTTFVQETVAADFEDLTEEVVSDLVESATDEELSAKLTAVPLIEKWIKAVWAKVEGELFAGRTVPGWKLVQGKRGARQWPDGDEAESTLKGMKLTVDQMYNKKLKSPAQIEKVIGPKGSHPAPRKWSKLQEMIVQKEGQPSVAPEDDPRPALEINPVADFENLEDGSDMV